MLLVDRVTKRYRDITAVDRVSFEVRGAGITALLGPNGAGKTSLVRMVMGITRPDEGGIELRDEGQAGLGRGDLGYLPEERGLYKDVPILRTLVFFAGLQGMGKKDARDAAMKWLERVDLGDRADAKIDELSRGNQQKVQFISAVLHRPRLVLLDEPFGGLDPVNQELFLGFIRDLARGGTTVLLSAHHMDLVERLADRLLLMHRGALVHDGTLAELRDARNLGERYTFELAPEHADAAARALGATAGVDAVTTESGDGAALVVASVRPGTGLGPLLASVDADRVRRLDRSVPSLHELYLDTIGGAAAEAA